MACNNDIAIFTSYSIVLEVFLVGTSNASNITLLVVLCTIWHEKMNGCNYCFHMKGINRNHNFIFKDFRVKFPVRSISPLSGKHRFLEYSVFSDSETLFKY